MNLLQKIGNHKIFVFTVLVFAYGIWTLMPYARTYVPFMIGSYLFAFIVYRNQRDEFKKLFDPEIWLHHTTLNEAFIIIIGYAFIATVIQHVYIFHPTSFSEGTISVLGAIGVKEFSQTPTILAGLLYIVFAILAHEAAYYLAHRLMHKSPALWEFHKVHHSAEVMTPFTSFRQHPVEYAINALFHAVFAGVTAAIFLHLYPSPTSLHFVIQYQLAKVVFLTLGGALAHSHAHISYGLFDKYIISPAMHQVHHSEDPKHYDKNFGFMLICFDRAFGTAYFPDKNERFTFGLGEEQNPQYHTIKGSIIDPFIHAWRKLAGEDSDAQPEPDNSK